MRGGEHPQPSNPLLSRQAQVGPTRIAPLVADLRMPEDGIKTHYDTHRADADFQQPERVTGEHILIAAFVLKPGICALLIVGGLTVVVMAYRRRQQPN